jgi:hypothetical protein
MPNNAIARAIDLINSSGYIRLCSGYGVRRISRAAAINAVLNTCRCKDCKDTNSDLCEACDQTVSELEIQGYFIHLDGYGGGVVIHV